MLRISGKLSISLPVQHPPHARHPACAVRTLFSITENMAVIAHMMHWNEERGDKTEKRGLELSDEKKRDTGKRTAMYELRDKEWELDKERYNWRGAELIWESWRDTGIRTPSGSDVVIPCSIPSHVAPPLHSVLLNNGGYSRCVSGKVLCSQVLSRRFVLFMVP